MSRVWRRSRTVTSWWHLTSRIKRWMMKNWKLWKIFCHHPIPALCIPIKQTQYPAWPNWPAGATSDLLFWKANASISVHQRTYTPIAYSLYRVWLAPSLTIWTEMEFGEGSGFEPATTECWSRALYPLHHGDFGTFIIQLPICIAQRNSLFAPSTMEVLIMLHQSFKFHEEHLLYVYILIPKCFIISM